MKNISSESKIILSVNSTLVTDQKEVSEIFNNFFINVANEIGKGVSFDSQTHPSCDFTQVFVKLREIQKRIIFSVSHV